MARTTKAEMAAQARDALAGAVRSLGHRAEMAPPGGDWDLDVVVDGIELPVSVAAAAVLTPATARTIAAGGKPGVAAVAVGDLVTRPARRDLQDAGWGWLDRRGHLVLRGPGVHVDADVPPAPRNLDGPTAPISGAAAVSWAAALLLSPDDPPPMRQVAREVGLSHSAVVGAAKRLRAAALLRSDGRPLVPELFWALAEVWTPRPLPLASLPSAAEAGTPAPDSDGAAPGWVLGGTIGALAWGAPVVVGQGYPPDFSVPSTLAVRQAARRWGTAPFEERACTVSAAPSPLGWTRRAWRPGGGPDAWPLAHGLFCALDLARDRARGAEILAAWDPADFTRVW